MKRSIVPSDASKKRSTAGPGPSGGPAWAQWGPCPGGGPPQLYPQPPEYIVAHSQT